MSAWSDDDAELLLRAGDGVSTVARLLGMDIERVEGIAAERSRAKLTLEDRQRIGEIRRELRGENPEPKPEPKPPKAPPAAARTTRILGLRSDRGEPWSSAGMGSMLAVAREREAIGTPDTAEQAACGAMFDAGAVVAGHLRARLRKNLAIEDAHRERDEAIAEMERINALLTKEQDLRWAERKDANEKIEQLKAELAAERRESAINQKAGVDLANQIGSERDEAQRETERLHARAESAEAEVRRLAGEVRGLAELAEAVRGLSAPRERPRDPPVGRIIVSDVCVGIEGLRAENEKLDRAPSVNISGAVPKMDPEQLRTAVESAEAQIRKVGAVRAHDGCSRPIHVRGLCREHYIPRWAAGEAPPPRASGCIADGCGKRVKAKNLCSKHYEQQRSPS